MKWTASVKLLGVHIDDNKLCKSARKEQNTPALLNSFLGLKETEVLVKF